MTEKKPLKEMTLGEAAHYLLKLHPKIIAKEYTNVKSLLEQHFSNLLCNSTEVESDTNGIYRLTINCPSPESQKAILHTIANCAEYMIACGEWSDDALPIVSGQGNNYRIVIEGAEIDGFMAGVLHHIHESKVPQRFVQPLDTDKKPTGKLAADIGWRALYELLDHLKMDQVRELAKQEDQNIR